MNRKLSIGTLREYLDDVIDVTNAGLPTLTSSNYRKLFIDHDTPRVWVGHREVLTATRAGGTTAEFTNASFDGAVSVDPVVTSIDRFIYHTTLHRWETSRTANGTFFFLPLSFNVIFTTTVGDTSPIWLGEQPDDETAIGLIDTFDNASAYYYYHEGSDTVRLLDNTTYTAATGRMVNYGAEPISAPIGSGSGTITGITTAATSGLAGGTTSGEATLSLDLSGLTAILGSDVDGQNDRLYIEDFSASIPDRRRITPEGLMQSFDLERLTNMSLSSISNTDVFFFRDISDNGNRHIRIDTVADYFVGGTGSALSQASGRMTVRAGGINELYLDGTNDPTTGQVLSSAGSNQFTWIDATGGGADTNSFVTAGAFTLSGSDVTLQLTGNAGFTAVNIPAFTIPDSDITSIAGTVPITATTDSSGAATIAIADGAILRAKLSRPLQAYFDTAPGVSYNSGTGVLDLDLTALYGPNPLDGDTYIFAAPANISGGSTSLSIRIFSGSAPIPLVRTDNTPVIESDLTSSQKYVATLVNDRWFLISGLASGGGGTDTNDYVDTAALSLNATNQLVATIGRTGTLADIVTTPLTLPSGATGIQTITPGDGIDVAISGTERTVTLETQYRGIQLGIDFFPDFNLLAGFYGITLNIPNLSFQALGNFPTGTTFSFQIPAIIEDLGTDASVLTFRPGTSGVTQDIVSQANGFPLTRGDLVAGAWHTVRKAVTDYVLIEPTAVVDNDALALSAPNTESPIEAASRRAVATAIAGVAGNKRTFLVPQAGVGGTVDDIVLTTGAAINLEDGDELYFTPMAGNTGPVTIAVDGNPAIDMVVYRNQGLRALKVGNLINAPAFVIFQESDNRFLWRPAAGSTAQYYEVGTGNFDIAILGPQGLFDPSRLGSGTSPTAGQYLAWASAGAAWIDLPAAGTGTITGITTATGSGLAGGALTGTPSLSLDFNNLTALTTSTIDTLDEFVLEDVSEATTPYRKMNLGNLVAHIAGPTGSGLTSADGRLSLVDEGILEPKLSVTNGPTTGQFLTAADSGRFTWVNAPVTVTVRGTRRQWFVADTDVTGAGNNITLNPRDAALTALQDGDTFVFRPNDDIGTSNSVNVLIRLTSPAKTVQRSNGAGGFTNVVIGDWTTGDLVVLQYSSGLDRLVWLGGMTGTASTRNTGTAGGEVAVLNSSGTFDPARQGGGGQANRVLTWASGAATWEDLPAAGAGDITSIITPATGGIAGGMASGDVTLELDINGLPTFGSIGASHFIPALFPSDNGKVTVTTLSTALNTILALNANRITAGVLEHERLSSDTPVANDILTYDGSNAAWTAAVGTVGARRFHIPDANVAGTGRAIVLTSGHSLTALQDGDGVSFTAQTTISGGQSAVTVAIDSVSAITVQHGGGDSVSDTFGSGELRQNFLIDLIYSADSDRLILVGTQSGSAVRFNVGDAEFNIPRLHAAGLLRLAWIPPLPAARITNGTFANARIADDSIAEVKLDMENDPMADYVIGWNGTTSQMTWRAEGTTPVQTHTRYFALGTTRTFVEADYTGGLTFMSDTFTVPTYTVDNYYAIAVPLTSPITAIIAATNPEQNITSQFTNEANLSIAGEDHQIWISNVQFFPAGSLTPIRLEA